jgi:hypothetical protein
MAKKFLTAIDLAKNELQNAQVHNLAAAPSSPVKGQLYMNTSDNTLYWWDGTTWQPAKSGAPAFGTITQEQTFGATKVDGVATTVARSDHGHGNPVHDNAAHSAVTLNSLAPPTAAINMNGQYIQNLLSPVGVSDAATKSYVDNLTAGLSWKEAVRAATTANGTLASAFANGSVIDGVTLATGNRILIKNQTTQTENGIYTVNVSGAPTRATDADTTGDLEGAAVFVMEGTTLADTGWVCTTNAPITIGSSNLTWAQFSGGAALTAGAGLVQNGNAFDVGAGTGITVAADSVALDTTYTDARYATPASVAAKADKTIVLTAGAGLTGGGDLSAARTFDVGAGTGVTVAADTVALDTTYTDGRYALKAAGSLRYAVAVGGAVSQVLTHNLNTSDVVVTLYRVASPFDEVECDIEHTSVNSVTVRFAVAPAASEYRAVVLA